MHYFLTNLLNKIYPKDTQAKIITRAMLPVVTLAVIAIDWKQPKCPSVVGTFIQWDCV